MLNLQDLRAPLWFPLTIGIICSLLNGTEKQEKWCRLPVWANRLDCKFLTAHSLQVYGRLQHLQGTKRWSKPRYIQSYKKEMTQEQWFWQDLTSWSRNVVKCRESSKKAATSDCAAIKFSPAFIDSFRTGGFNKSVTPRHQELGHDSAKA